jgi:hypothetical protein
MPTFRRRVFRLHFLFRPLLNSGNSRFQTTLHALRFSASFNQELTADRDLVFTLRHSRGIAFRYSRIVERLMRVAE